MELTEGIKNPTKVESEPVSETEEKENFKRRDKNFSEENKKLQHYLDFFRDRIILDKPLREQTGNLSKEVSQQFEEQARLVADAGLNGDTNLYMAFKCLEFLGEEDRVRERVALGLRLNGHDQVSYSLLRATLKYGTEEQIRKAILEYAAEYGIESIEFADYIQDKLRPISENFNRYAEKSNLEPRFITAEWLNAAFELEKQKYDLIVGVMNSGKYIANLMEFFGETVRYVEWHRHWKRSPVLRNIGGSTERIYEANKILICEQDTRSGATLKALIPFLKKLNPAQVDICFWIDHYGINDKNVKDIGFYQNSFHTYTIPSSDLFNHIKTAEDLVEATKGGNEKFD